MTKRNAFLSDRRGNVAVTFALGLLPMVGLVGIGIDYTNMLSVKARLDAAADAAALAAATEASNLVQQLVGQSTALSTALNYGQQAGQQVFATDVATVKSQLAGSGVTPTIQVSQTGRTISATATYSTASKNAFGPMFGVSSLAIVGKANATLQLPNFMNISVVVDVSQSMGLASTSAGMTALQNLTPDRCAFGCHVVSSAQLAAKYVGTLYTYTPYEQLAHANGISLRIDVIRGATQNMISTAQSVGNNKISFSLYTMQYGLTPLAVSSMNYAALQTATNGIDLGANNSGGTGDSNFAAAMPALSTAVPIAGDGSSLAAAQQFVFIMTDGVQDVAGSCTDGHCTKAFDPSTCAALKARGVTVGVIYTTYLSMPQEQTFLDLVQPFWSNLPVNLKACASPGWYYEASDATAIQNAVTSLFNQATNKGVLTQ